MAILNKRIQEQADAIDNHIIDALKSGNSFIVEAGSRRAAALPHAGLL